MIFHSYVSLQTRVIQIPTPHAAESLKNIRVPWDDDIPNLQWKNMSCHVPVTTNQGLPARLEPQPVRQDFCRAAIPLPFELVPGFTIQTFWPNQPPCRDHCGNNDSSLSQRRPGGVPSWYFSHQKWDHLGDVWYERDGIICIIIWVSPKQLDTCWNEQLSHIQRVNW